MRSIRIIFSGVLTLGVMPQAYAASESYEIVILNHRFEPAELTIPAGQKVKLVVDNRDATPEEFESHELIPRRVAARFAKAG